MYLNLQNLLNKLMCSIGANAASFIPGYWFKSFKLQFKAKCYIGLNGFKPKPSAYWFKPI